ncbi:hypothetical protein [Rhizobium tubonense]|uniref:Uncharacterized protein n=1 Tax=Rhizobium tubonense TaxID=484088 RepID=A0A2W4E4X2_9HYPH|nr:hypothetical protein [Rhizobium tubonense]PZM07593.1 hypothetical protein CPY51_31180 [Rhizobium tubonense]
MSLRERFIEMMGEEMKTLHFFSETGAKQLHAEGYDVAVDITEQTIAESKRRIAMYEALIARIDKEGEQSSAESSG